MNPVDDTVPPERLRVMQWIAGALTVGVAAFLSVVLCIVAVQNGGRGNAAAGDLPIVSFIAAGMLAVNAFMASLLPGMMTRNALKQMVSRAWQAPHGTDPAEIGTDADKLLGIRQTTLIVTLALLEGAAFCGCIGFLLEAQTWVLGVVAGALTLMLMNFPSASRVRAWMQQQTEALADLRRWQ